MNHSFIRKYLPVIIGATLYLFTLGYFQVVLAWICLVPLFLRLDTYSRKTAFCAGAIFGLIVGIVALYWLPLTVFSLSNGSLLQSILMAIPVIAIPVVYYGLILLAFSLLRRKSRWLWTNALILAAIWTIGEWLLALVFAGMPWLSFGVGSILLGNLYAIQPAAFAGIYILHFAVVFVNYLFAHFIARKQWRALVLPVGAAAVYMTAGYGIWYVYCAQALKPERQVSVVVLSGNIPATLPWNEANGSMLAARLLGLNEQALKAKPDIVLWPESAVPWTYSPGDDFIKEVVKSSAQSPGTCHIIGMATYLNSHENYNSAYSLLADGRVTGRHDKYHLVSMAEKPLSIGSLSFFKDEALTYCRVGREGTVLPTPGGKAGVLICSEVMAPGAARAAVAHGAQFLVSLSNDALFGSARGPINQQFYRNRLRAVETRKDIAVSCNMGTSGKVAASGEMITFEDTENGIAESVQLVPNDYQPVPVCYGTAFLGSLVAVLLLSIAYNPSDS